VEIKNGMIHRVITGKASLTISAKPVKVGASSQRLILPGKK
jgi:hypothetical protein